MGKIFEKIPPLSNFAKNVLALMTGAGIAQIISVLASPILSRIFDTSDFGVLGAFQSTITIITIFISARYEQLVVIPKDEKDSINIFALSFIIMGIVSILLFTIVLFFPNLIVSITGEELSSWIIYIPLGALLVGIVQLLNAYFIRRKYFKQTSQSVVGQSLTRVGVNLGVGINNVFSGGLIYGYLAGQLATIFILLHKRIREIWNDLRSHFTWSHCVLMAKKYKKMALNLIPANLIGAFAGNLPSLLLPLLFNTSIAGLYFWSYTIVNMPLAFIGKSLSDVAYKHTMDIIHSNNSLSEYFERVIAYLLLFTIVPILVMLLFAPLLFAFVFGEEYRMAGVYTQILLPYFLLRLLSAPTSVLVQKNRTDLLLYWQILFLILTITSLALGGLVFESHLSTIILLSISNTISYAVVLYLNFKITEAKWSNIYCILKDLSLKVIRRLK